jgi:hypothetical protein
MDENLVAELKAKYGTVFELSCPANEEAGIPALTVCCRKPTREEFARFTKEASASVAMAMTNLLVGCLVHPAGNDPELQAIFAEYPGLAFVIGGKLTTLVGGTIEAAVKKL